MASQFFRLVLNGQNHNRSKRCACGIARCRTGCCFAGAYAYLDCCPVLCPSVLASTGWGTAAQPKTEKYKMNARPLSCSTCFLASSCSEDRSAYFFSTQYHPARVFQARAETARPQAHLESFPATFERVCKGLPVRKLKMNLHPKFSLLRIISPDHILRKLSGPLQCILVVLTRFE